MNYYAVLGVSADADEELIRAAFRSLARQYHPDVGAGSSAEKFRQIVEAYDTLRDPRRRARYDASLRRVIPRTPPIRTAEPTRSYAYAEPLRPEVRNPEFAFHAFFDDVQLDDLLADIFDFFDTGFWGDPGRSR